MFEGIKRLFENQEGLSKKQSDIYWDKARKTVNEELLMEYIKADELESFVAGMGGTRFVDKSDLSFTDARIVLEYIYRAYRKHPDMHIDDMLERSLIKLLLDGSDGYFYAAINTLDVQLQNEKDKKSPFTIDDPQVFIALKKAIIEKMDYLKRSKRYKGRLYDNNLFGFVEDIDRKLEEQKGVRII